MLFYALRAFLKLRAEPLLEHLPPFGEPYDHGAYLYEAFSWAHLYDKFMFHFWLAPFGLVTFAVLGIAFRRKIFSDRWAIFLFHLSLWALLWSTLFYPQLRTRDWDLFASMAIPLNLFVVYALHGVMRPNVFRLTMSVLIAVQLVITLPIVIRNSALFTDRGYVQLNYEPQPSIPARAFLRGLELGISPIEHANIRAGQAEVRIVPLERGYQSWSKALYLEPGGRYLFNPVLKEATNTIRRQSGDQGAS